MCIRDRYYTDGSMAFLKSAGGDEDNSTALSTLGTVSYTHLRLATILLTVMTVLFLAIKILNGCWDGARHSCLLYTAKIWLMPMK